MKYKREQQCKNQKEPGDDRLDEQSSKSDENENVSKIMKVMFRKLYFKQQITERWHFKKKYNSSKKLGLFLNLINSNR